MISFVDGFTCFVACCVVLSFWQAPCTSPTASVYISTLSFACQNHLLPLITTLIPVLMRPYASHHSYSQVNYTRVLITYSTK